MKYILLLFLSILNSQINAQWIQKGVSINGENIDDRFGYSTAINGNGNTIIVGATRNPGLASDAGHARVYKYTNNAWVKLGNDLDGTDDFDDFSFSVAMSDDGNTIAISAPYNDGGFSYRGTTKVYTLQSNNWVQLGATIIGKNDGDQSGFSTSLSKDGRTIAIGAPLSKFKGNNAGATYVFKLVNNIWTPVGNDLYGIDSLQMYGITVDLSDDGKILAVGSTYEMVPFTTKDNATVYTLVNNIWSKLGSEIVGNSSDNKFGNSISINGNGTILAVGSPETISNSAVRGAVKVFKYDQGAWSQIGSNMIGDANADQFGRSVSISADGKSVAIGAYRNIGNQDEKGQVKIFKFKNSNWSQQWSDLIGFVADENAGYSVSISSDGRSVLYGAPWATSSPGTARVYSTCISDIGITQIKDTLFANQLGATYRWFKGSNLNLITGETKRFIKATYLENYAVEIKIGNCIDTSELIFNSFQSSSIQDISNNSFSIYPNPIKDKFNIYLNKKLVHGTFQIYNLIGKLIFEGLIDNSEQIQIDNFNLDNGLYYIQINDYEKSIGVKKIVVE
jgi:hypothetical protein